MPDELYSDDDCLRLPEPRIDANGKDFPVSISYNPYFAGYFTTPNGREVNGAGGVLLKGHGMTACYLE